MERYGVSARSLSDISAHSWRPDALESVLADAYGALWNVRAARLHLSAIS